MARPRILVVDDEESIRNLLKGRLSREGYEIVAAANGDDAMRMLATPGPDFGVVVTDLKMPGKDGLTLVKEGRTKFPQVRWVIITGHGDKAAAIQAIRNGASDYLEKPFDLDELTHIVQRCVKEFQLERENVDLVDRLEARVARVEGKAEDKYWFVSKSTSMAKVNDWLAVLRREAMRGDAEEPSVLVLGESGTGKEGVARMIHAGSRRAKGPWVAVNCANFSEQLLESELFGHERGAFTGANATKRGLFEIAKGGTLFLDEIGEMDVKLQAKLLRVLQEKAFRRVGGTVDNASDVRVVAATNRDLGARVRQGGFREDLFHRLSRVVIELPSLRERADDIVPMGKEFCARAFEGRGKKFSGLAPDAETALRAYSWPGNIRELLNVIERTALVWEGSGAINARALGLPEGATAAGTLEVLSSPIELKTELDQSFTELKKKWSDAFEREYLVAILQRHTGNVSAAARESRLDRSNFLRLLRRHQIRAQEYRKVTLINGVPTYSPAMDDIEGESEAA